MRNRRAELKAYYLKLKKEDIMSELKRQYKKDTGLNANAFNDEELDIMASEDIDGKIELSQKAKDIIFSLPSLKYVKWLESKIIELNEEDDFRNAFKLILEEFNKSNDNLINKDLFEKIIELPIINARDNPEKIIHDLIDNIEN